MNTETDPANQSYPSTGYAWYMVVLLTIAYIFSFVDRYILNLLVQPIKAEFDLTDTQMGLLGGAAFAIFYATMGLPLGYLADRKRRTWLLAGGIAIWSIATAASGLAGRYWHLFAARMGVGAGEATLGPCAMSMISDSFPREKRGKPIAFYSSALSLGAGIASIVGATVITWAQSVPEISIPLVGAVAPWQLTFFIVGIPGIFVAVLMFTIREPVRRYTTGKKTGGNLLDTLQHIGRRWKVYGCCIAFAAMMIIVAYSQFFYAAMFERTWGWDNVKYGAVNGIVLLAVGPLTVIVAGWMNDRLYSRGVLDAPLVIMIIGALLIVPTGIAAPLMPTPELAFLIIAFNTIGIATTTATSLTALMNITPAEIRGQTVAVYYMIVSLAGLLLGPLTVGLFSDYVFGNEFLNYAGSATTALYGIPVLLLIPFARRLYLNEHQARHGAPA